jgi:hypothetical protein
MMGKPRLAAEKTRYMGTFQLKMADRADSNPQERFVSRPTLVMEVSRARDLRNAMIRQFT